jgi:hypothetical protein
MENDLFFLTAYREMLLRMPDPGTCDKRSDMMNKPAETFQQSLVKSLCNSKEIRIKRVRLRNNPYSELYYNEGTASGFGRLEKLHKLYMRLPELIRRLIKKIFC